MPHLYRVVCPQVSEELLEAWLSPRERALYERFPPRRARSWLAGRLAAKALLREHLAGATGGGTSDGMHPSPREIEIVSTSSGAPRALVRGEPLAISLSLAHCGDWGLAGIADPRGEGSIGVDLERVRPVHPRLAERLLQRGERELLDELDPHGGDSSMILAWTLKEAAYKALRPSLPSGASLPLRELRLCRAPDGVDVSYTLEGREVTLPAHAERVGDFWVAWALLPFSR